VLGQHFEGDPHTHIEKKPNEQSPLFPSSKRESTLAPIASFVKDDKLTWAIAISSVQRRCITLFCFTSILLLVLLVVVKDR
jgi:hypothetical protein